MRVCIFLFLLFAGVSRALICNRENGRIKQIDASNGQVFAVDRLGNVFTRRGSFWARVPGKLAHVTVGAAGVWGVGRDQTLYRMVAGSWALLGGQLTQIDAGGDQIVAGVNRHSNIFCADKQSAVRAADYRSPAYRQINGRMRYYSCGPQSCWGITAQGLIYCRLNVHANFCTGSRWLRVSGRFVVVEVGTDGSVYAVSRAGLVYRRTADTD
ncbi:fish-egg lectin-like isoform X2 [Heterodontus francisci]|uniref:fish-egg lectin-like isoform X2 n=1 Tax=Heterodontus francisci TaxID=7792 RepID=UPI00355C0A87